MIWQSNGEVKRSTVQMQTNAINPSHHHFIGAINSQSWVVYVYDIALPQSYIL